MQTASHPRLERAAQRLAELEQPVETPPILSEARALNDELTRLIMDVRGATTQATVGEAEALIARAHARRDRLGREEKNYFGSVRDRIRNNFAAPGEALGLLERRITPGLPDLTQDDADRFFDKLIDAPQPPTPVQAEGHLPYVAMPLRKVLEAVRLLDLRSEDVFWDLGCGIGRVLIIAKLASPAKVCGIEFEPRLCRAAYVNIASMRVDATIVEGDATTYDYGDATAFMMFYPVAGELVTALLARLQECAARRPIRIAAWGPSNAVLSQQAWLKGPAEPSAGLSRYDSVS